MSKASDCRSTAELFKRNNFEEYKLYLYLIDLINEEANKGKMELIYTHSCTSFRGNLDEVECLLIEDDFYVTKAINAFDFNSKRLKPLSFILTINW